MSRKTLFIFSVLITIFYLFAYRKLFGFNNFVYSDLTPFHDFSYAWNLTFSRWGSHDFGSPVIAMPFHLVFGFLGLFFGDINLFQKFFWFSLLPISAFTMVYLLYKLRLFKSELAICLAAFFYSFNPISIIMFSIGVPLYLFLYAFQPIFLYFFLNSFEQKSGLKQIIICSLLFSFVGSYGRDMLIVESLMFFLTFIAYWLFFKFDIKKIYYSIRFYILSVLFFFLINFYFFATSLENIYLLLKNIITQEIIHPATQMGSLLDFKARYWSTIPLNFFALFGSHAEWLTDFYPNPLFFISLFAVIIAVASLLITRNKKKFLFVIPLIFFYTFLYLARTGKLDTMIKSFPFLVVFRESYKILALLPLFCAPLIAISLNWFFNKFNINHEK